SPSAPVPAVAALRVVAGVFLLVLDPAERDRAVPRGVAPDRVAAVLHPGYELDRFVVCAHRLLIFGAEEEEVAFEVAGAGAWLDGLRGLVGDRAHDAQRTVDVRHARGVRSLVPSVEFLLAEAPAESLADAKEREAEVEGAVGALSQELRRADVPFRAAAGG